MLRVCAICQWFPTFLALWRGSSGNSGMGEGERGDGFTCTPAACTNGTLCTCPLAHYLSSPVHNGPQTRGWGPLPYASSLMGENPHIKYRPSVSDAHTQRFSPATPVPVLHIFSYTATPIP